MKLGILSDRKISTFPLSIGTSFAMEAFEEGQKEPYDFARIPTPKLNPADYEEFWINLVTLHRNMVNSISSADARSVSPEEYATELEIEVDVIRSFMAARVPGVKPIFYSCAYRGLKKAYPHAQLALTRTPKQEFLQSLTGRTISEFYKKNKLGAGLRHFELDIKPTNRSKALILTHYAHDLTAKGFDTIDLLESHTGAVKGKSQWWTKFTDQRTQRIPLTKLTLQIFGDSTLFYMHNLKIREELIDLAENNKWTYATTDERIRLCIGLIKEPYAREVLKTMV